MLSKIKKYQNHEVVKSLSDVRTIDMIVFLIISLLVTWSSVRVVQANYDLQKEISALQQVNDVQQLKNNNLKLRNEYYKTDTYLELAARRHYNKALPGEKLIIVPKTIAMAHSIDVPKPKTATENITEAKKASGTSLQRNFNAWLNFLLHRQTD